MIRKLSYIAIEIKAKPLKSFNHSKQIILKFNVFKFSINLKISFQISLFVNIQTIRKYFQSKTNCIKNFVEISKNSKL